MCWAQGGAPNRGGFSMSQLLWVSGWGASVDVRELTRKACCGGKETTGHVLPCVVFSIIPLYIQKSYFFSSFIFFTLTGNQWMNCLWDLEIIANVTWNNTGWIWNVPPLQPRVKVNLFEMENPPRMRIHRSFLSLDGLVKICECEQFLPKPWNIGAKTFFDAIKRHFIELLHGQWMTLFVDTVMCGFGR